MGHFVAAPRRRKREEKEDEEDGVTRAIHAFIVENSTTSVLGRNYARRCHARHSVSYGKYEGWCRPKPFAFEINCLAPIPFCF